MRLTLVQSGGVAGLVRKPLVLDSDSLPRSVAETLAHLVTKARFFDLPAEIPGPVLPDVFGYELTVEVGGRSHTVSFDRATASAALRELTTAMRSIAAK